MVKRKKSNLRKKRANHRKIRKIARKIPIEKFIALKLESYFKKAGQLGEENIYSSLINAVEKAVISFVLEKSSFNQIKSAQILGLHRNTLRNKIKELKIKLPA